MTFKVYPYKQGSTSAKVLAVSLGGKVLKKAGSKYRPKRGDVVINWGSSNVPNFAPATTLNANVEVAQCKLATFKALSVAGVRVPQFVEDKNVVAVTQHWPVVCRTKLKGHSGEGIVIANNPDELIDAPLYTKYIKKRNEYRVHVLYNKPFFVQRKARKLDVADPNWMVRNLAGGFVFAECEVEEVPEDVINQACKAIEALAIDFGGVDVIWNEREKAAYVLECNTACGLEGRTAERYKAAIVANLEA